MLCDDAIGVVDASFLEKWALRGKHERVPLTGSIALTHRCNLHCLHCYAGPESCGAIQSELSTQRWLELLDEMVAEGCLFLLLTGGDPLLRPDFAEIYRHAKEAGMLVTVFTNGTLVDESVLDLFEELPPRVVEISVYGATAATHEAVTGIPGSFKRAIAAVEVLLERGVKLRLKSVLMQPNLAEFRAIRSMAEEKYGVEFRMDAAIFPRFDGDLAPLELRVDAKVAVEIEMDTPGTIDKWRRVQRQSSELVVSDKLYKCGAGMIGFHVDPAGMLHPCLMAIDIGADLSQISFCDGWRRIVDDINAKKVSKSLKCNGCKDSVMCGWCPGYALLECGNANRVPSYLCELGQFRKEMLGSGNSVS